MRLITLLLTGLLTGLLIQSSIGSYQGVTLAQAAPLINGAGATFPYPLYSKWFSEFQKSTGIQINYQSIGSGGGVRQLLERTVDFGASDAPMTEEQQAKATKPILHIPTVLGAVVLTYNVPGVEKGLKLSSEVLAEIYLGKITKWNDPKLVALNPAIKLPGDSILVVRRSDGSGTTFVFTDYLSKVSPDWLKQVGRGTAVNWPAGMGGKGNEGVTGLVKQTPGSIGYVELIFAETNKLPYATIKNHAGEFVTPTLKSVTAAGETALKTMPEDFRVSITDAPGKGAYPISSYTYLLVYKTMPKDKGQPLLQFLHWAIKDGQKFAEPLSYSPLPKGLLPKIEAKLKSIVLE